MREIGEGDRGLLLVTHVPTHVHTTYISTLQHRLGCHQHFLTVLQDTQQSLQNGLLSLHTLSSTGYTVTCSSQPLQALRNLPCSVTHWTAGSTTLLPSLAGHGERKEEGAEVLGRGGERVGGGGQGGGGDGRERCLPAE